MELIDSKYTREKFAELGVEFDEWQKAVNVNIKMLKKWKIKMYIFLCFIPQLVFPRRTAFL